MRARAHWLLLSPLLVACPSNRPAPAPTASVSAPAPSAPSVEPEDDGEQARLVAKNPEGLRFRISLPNGDRYQQGERIVVELAFSSTTPNTFKLDGGLYDRSGRLKLDDYRVSPARTVDPLYDYYHSQMGFAGGGLRTMPVLGEKPHTMRFELNEWHRFDVPGRYRVYVVSKRLQWQRPDEPDAAIEGHDVVSENAVEFNVVPAESAWQARTLRDALRVLDASGSTEEARRDAARTVRFLNTKAAVSAMAERVASSDQSFHLSFGLYGSPHREAAIRALDDQITRPDTPISGTLLDTLVLLKQWRDGGKKKASHEDRARIRHAILERLVAALPKKTLKARGVCVDALLMLGSGMLEPDWVTRINAEVPAVLPGLSLESLDGLLRYRFRPLAKLPLAAPLQQVLSRSDLTPEVRQIALLRLLQVAPVEARKRVVTIIATGAPDLGRQALDTLGKLPDASLSEVDDAVVTRLEQCGEHCHPDQQLLLAGLIQRYATKKSAARVRAAYDALQVFDDDSDGAFLAYFFRVDLAYARQALARRLRDKPKGSAVTLLSALARRGYAKFAEPELIATLDSKHVFNATMAARELSRYGSKAAESALHRRLRTLSKRWKGKSKELAPPLIGKSAAGEDGQLERELWLAVVNGRGWLTDLAAMRRLQSLVVSEQEREQLQYRIKDWESGRFAFRWTELDSGAVDARIAHYDLDSVEAVEQKVAQFPRGSKFEWRPYDDDPAEFERARKLLAKYGHTLVRP